MPAGSFPSGSFHADRGVSILVIEGTNHQCGLAKRRLSVIDACKHGAIIWRLLPFAVYDGRRQNAWAKSIVIGLVFPSISLWQLTEWSFVRFA
jgi:hypothetical protein